MPTSPRSAAPNESDGVVRRFTGVFRYSRRAIELVWDTNRTLTLLLGALTIVAGVLPAAIAYVGQLIVDGVVAAMNEPSHNAQRVLRFVALEGLLVATVAGAQRGLSACQSLLRAQLGHRVNILILEKALTLRLEQFEDADFYDKLTRARREASSRPLSLVNRTFGLAQNGLSLLSYGVLLLQFSPWAVLILALAGLPAFIAEARFSGDAFRLFRWRSPESRMQIYLETVLAREDSAKEVKLFNLGPRLLERYRGIFARLYKEDRALTLRRDGWGFGLGLIATAAFYGAYAWIVLATVRSGITLGEMTMYLILFRQGQSAVTAILSSVSGMYEDNLYLSTLYEFLEQTVAVGGGKATTGLNEGDGIRFEAVSFVYPGASSRALHDITLHLKPGESLALVGENGSGKTTLIKLLTRLYEPTEGRILLDGRPLPDWDHATLLKRVGVIFQDFGRYQFTVGENIGAGNETHFDDAERWRGAAAAGMAAPFIENLPKQYSTRLGRWFAQGQELSGGQWQKIALSRAFMRDDADILVLDEPTAAMDAAAEAQVFDHVRASAKDRMVILISHRFSTVRAAEHILVMEDGRIIERGNHDSLMASGGRYADLFELQAAGYR
ncbi:MAG: ABC transporter ATP-binding protein [Pseudomonadota bacterium]